MTPHPILVPYLIRARRPWTAIETACRRAELALSRLAEVRPCETCHTETSVEQLSGGLAALCPGCRGEEA